MKAAASLIGGVVAAMMGLIVLVAAVAGGSAGTSANQSNQSSHGGLSSAVPAQWRDALLRYGNQCPEISPALLAAQIEAESGWNPAAVSPVGAVGLSQFMPGTWAAYGTDGDGDGKADPHNGNDAIASQARYMCTLAVLLRGMSGLTGDFTDLLLAAYNAGPGAVQNAGGVPQIAETLGYIRRIRESLAKYQVAITVGGAWADPLPPGTYVRGTPFHKYGPMWRWKGWHTGADYEAPTGTPILSAGPGTIKAILTGGAYGNHVLIDHGVVDGKQVTGLYAHMTAFQPGLQTGQAIQTGAQIGFVGATGNVTGPHLHMEIRLDYTDGANDAEFADPWAWIDSHRQPPTGALGQAIVTKARTWLATPYSWGGGDKSGPTKGFGPGAATVGFDCSGLVLASVYGASNGRITLPRTTTGQATQGINVNPADRQPGDLIFFDLAGKGDWTHVGIYIGGGQMLHAPSTGKTVEITTLAGYYAGKPQITRRLQ